MKLSIFPIIRLTLGLFCLIPGVSSAETVATAVYHLSAKVAASTCETQLTTFNHVSPDIDFGLLTAESPEKTKEITVVLDCTNTIFQPQTIKLSFGPSATGYVDPNNEGRLYSRISGSSPQSVGTGLYYDWQWGAIFSIDNTISVNKIFPYTTVNLRDNSTNTYPLIEGADVYDFPLIITRRVNNFSEVTAGEYETSVIVNISYQ
ncbi:type 1 fimbrial protein [Proteus terrae]|uniref:type 1 fimbrial protein n=1 Tax=Proteus TaxID=583 RepID=UPI000D6E96F4|nr:MULTISPECIES: type 1 fimbrial protein [Proteus]MCO7050970.1 type 1 fimbrial protein [Proteus terrae]MCS6713391.1 type 1 fimbrial protein [Proteus terrae]MCS6731472.1 type 1 fimbrial protein [Proteus terrae]MCW9688298.1 type 1 fimbrial protein [Proteus terrae]